MQTFIRALNLRFEVVFALMMREVHTRYGRENIGFLWLIGEPLLFCLGITLLWWAIKPTYEHGIPVIAFVMTGYGPLQIWRHCVQRATHCFRANSSLLYHKQVGIFDLLISRVILEICGGIGAFFILAILFFSIGLYSPPKNLSLFYLGWFHIILFSAACAFVFACITEIAEWTERLVGPITYFMVPLSGFVFMVDWLPAKAQQLALYMPTVSAYEMIRGGQFGDAVRIHVNGFYSAIFSLIVFLIGLALIPIARKKMEIT